MSSTGRTFRRMFLFASTLLLLAGTICLQTASAAPPRPSNSNWAGYVVQDSSRSDLRGSFGSWIVPKIECVAGENSVSSTWVGLGGDTVTGKSTVETLYQTGSYAACINGSPHYYAFAEDFGAPNLAQDIASGHYDTKPVVLGCPTSELCPTATSVQPGDAITASVVDHSTNTRWTIADSRDGADVWSHSKFWLTHAHRHTAECIVEDPVLAGIHAVNFPAFQSVSFATRCKAMLSGNVWSVSASSLPNGWKAHRFNVVSGRGSSYRDCCSR